MTTTTITIKCGCGHRNPIASVAAEVRCSMCRTPLITENPPTNKHVKTFTVSRQCDLTTTVDATPEKLRAEPGQLKDPRP